MVENVSTMTRKLGAVVLDALAEVWPSPTRKRDERLGGAALNTDAHHAAYAEDQYLSRMRNGLGLGAFAPPLWGKTVLEIGCGHGGITCYLASLGAKHVVGVDVNVADVEYGRKLAKRIAGSSARLNGTLPVSFVKMDARALAFADRTFDIVMADNVFEHFDNPEKVLAEVSRVLVPGGSLLIPTFSSIWSKHGLHLKYGIKVPWTNLVFEESTILEALKRRAARHPALLDAYPGLRNNPQKIRDVRRHRDLNGITHSAFLELARAAGFAIKHFEVHATPVGRVIRKLMPVGDTKAIFEILSTGAAVVLEKTAEVSHRGSLS